MKPVLDRLRRGSPLWLGMGLLLAPAAGASAVPLHGVKVQAQQAQGQTQGQAQGPAQGQAAADTVRPIPVTGVVVDLLKAPVRTDRAPFAVSVLDLELTTHRGRAGTSLEEALQGLPGVHVQNRFNEAVGERISIRGFGARSQFGVRGLRILVDGIPATLPDGQSTLDHLDLGSLGRVEALRGPAASIYGNAAGGVLNLSTRAPDVGPARQELRWIGGDHGLKRIQATTSGASPSGQSYLVSVARQDWEGFRIVPSGAEGETYGKSLRQQVNATGTLPLAGGKLRMTLNVLDLDAENPGSLNQADTERGDRRAFPQNITQRTGKTIEQGQVGAQWEGPMRGTRTLEVATWGITRALSNPLPAAIIDVDRVAGGARALLRSSSELEGAGIWWGAGIETEVQIDDRANWTNVLGNRGVQSVDQRERVLGGALFAQTLIPLRERVDGMAGIRYDRIRFSARDRRLPTPGVPDESGVRTMDALSPSVGIHAALRREAGVYVNVSTTFETPTTTELANRPEGAGGFNAQVEPQRGRTAEVGGRGVLGSVATWDLALFHTALYNELVPFEVESSPGRRYFRNAGRSERQGWEASVRLTPHRWVDARVSFTRVDARFLDYQVGTVDFSGRKVPGVAPHRLEGLLRVGAPGVWAVEVRGESTAATPSNDANAPNALSPSYRLLDLRASANAVPVRSGISISPFLAITNLRDEPYNSSVTVNAFGGRFFEPGPGRTLVLGGSVLFQRDRP